MKNKGWLIYALITLVTWGVWGAFSEIPAQHGFPSTMVYVAWAVSMVPCAIGALALNRWRFNADRRSVFLGCMVGFLGAGGQLILFEALRLGPAYIVFPFISMSPVVTVALSMIFLKERPNKVQLAGIIIALAAIFFLSWQDKTDENVSGWFWIVLAALIFIAWGVQGFYMKKANAVLNSEVVFVYMTITAVLLIPVAVAMTPQGQLSEQTASMSGSRLFWIAFAIQILNSIGALTLNFAYKYGKAIIISPMQGLAPVLTVIISLLIYSKIPGTMLAVGLVLATVAIVLLSLEPKEK